MLSLHDRSRRRANQWALRDTLKENATYTFRKRGEADDSISFVALACYVQKLMFEAITSIAKPAPLYLARGIPQAIRETVGISGHLPTNPANSVRRVQAVEFLVHPSGCRQTSPGLLWDGSHGQLLWYSKTGRFSMCVMRDDLLGQSVAYQRTHAG